MMNSEWITKLYLWACQQLYNKFAWSYDSVSWVVSMGRWSKWRSAALDYTKNDDLRAYSVLEIGFGTGELLIQITKKQMSVIGLELSPAMHCITKNKADQQNLCISQIQGIAQNMPFASNQFDNIISTFPASYIFEQETLHECARLLRRPQINLENSGGELIIIGAWVTLDIPLIGNILPFYSGRPDKKILERLRQCMNNAGLNVRFEEHRDGFAYVSVIIAERVE